MNCGRTVFSQLIAFLPDRDFRRCVSRYGGDRRLRDFSCWDQFLAMAFAQLCAQALCLEEMFGKPVVCGAIFHAASKRRREVKFTADLRKLTEDAVAELHRLVEAGRVPPAVLKPACEECSRYLICLPQITSRSSSAAKAAAELFRT